MQRMMDEFLISDDKSLIQPERVLELLSKSYWAADRDLEEAPLAAALLLSEDLGLGERFRQLAAKELNLRKKVLAALEADAGKIVAKASEEAAQS